MHSLIRYSRTLNNQRDIPCYNYLCTNNHVHVLFCSIILFMKLNYWRNIPYLKTTRCYLNYYTKILITLFFYDFFLRFPTAFEGFLKSLQIVQARPNKCFQTFFQKFAKRLLRISEDFWTGDYWMLSGRSGDVSIIHQQI